MTDQILGLDIGDFSVKAVQVTGGLKGYHLTACARVDIDQDKGLEDALKALFEEIPFDGEGGCIASFPVDRVSFRNLSMPFKDKKKIGRTIGYELEPMLPFSVEALTTDYVVTEHSEQPWVLSASIRQEALAQYFDVLQAHQIDPDVVDLSGVPTAVQLAKHDHVPSDALLIDMGSRATSVILFSRRSVALVRSFHIGGDTITEAIAKSKEVSHEEAEKLKCRGGVEEFTDVVRPAVQSFCQEIRNTLHAFRYRVMKDVNPEKVFLTGGGALYPGMASMLQDFLELPVDLVDLTEPQPALEIQEEASESWNPLLMNSALALALRDTKSRESFDFRVDEFKKHKKFDQFKDDIKRLAICAGIILLALVADIYADYHTVSKRHDQLQQEITAIFKNTFPGVTRIVEPAQQMKVKLREAKESMVLPTDSSVHGAVVDVLRDIALRIPKTADVDVANLIIDEDRVRLKGLTDKFKTVDAVKNGLQESGYFKDVAIASAQLDRTGNRVRFELVMGRK